MKQDVVVMFPGELPGSAGEAGEDEEPVGSGGVDRSVERRVTKHNTDIQQDGIRATYTTHVYWWNRSSGSLLALQSQ